MYKTSTYALPLALLAHGVARSAAACDGVISSFTAECTYANFVDNLSADCSLDELFPPADDGSAPVYADEIAEACEFGAPTAFVEIQGTYQRDRRYFAGDGPLVDGGDWELDSARLRRFEDNLGSSTLIGFPEYAARVQYNVDENGNATRGYPANMDLEAGCDLRTVMCCFADDARGAGFDATTDVCRHDLRDSPESSHIHRGWSVFPGVETLTHCVGFTWEEGEEELLGNAMYDVSLRNSINKGYLKGVPGAPMCGCVEHMPVVEEAACRTATKTSEITYSFGHAPAAPSLHAPSACRENGGFDNDCCALPGTAECAEGFVFSTGDLCCGSAGCLDTICTEETGGYVYASNAVGIEYGDCAAGDLKAQFVANQGGDAARAALIDTHLVGAGGCEEDVADYLNEEQFLIQHQDDTKYITPDPVRWSDQVVGEGIYFLPAGIDPVEADEDFRDLIEGGCTDADGNSRLCIVRRICSTCYESHRDVYYQRLTPLPTPESSDFLDLFMNQWVSQDNERAVDFELYSSYEDARAGKDAWTYCNYNGDVGFPRDCGPTGHVGSNWNSYERNGGYADHHGFYVERP